LGGDFNLIY
jgi:hypothetical protein